MRAVKQWEEGINDEEEEKRWINRREREWSIRRKVTDIIGYLLI